MYNEMKLEFEAISANEGLARVAAAAFATPCNPTLEEIADIKTSVSEAVTNAIIHGYDGKGGKIVLLGTLRDNRLHIEVIDYGKGIADIAKAMEPLYTSRPELERSGMGFSFMEAFMDRLQVRSVPGSGTHIIMEKQIGEEGDDAERAAALHASDSGSEA